MMAKISEKMTVSTELVEGIVWSSYALIVPHRVAVVKPYILTVLIRDRDVNINFLT